ncbi:conserved hypothetical protein [Theileria equi strain WA]|uniref:Uncharacterized protein n=1 Tax=Theileria equi strain WA TaxID=1537102 RepID=L1LFI3_THEEQ|nr:conserved hypothetical protein [Theileria equi strain WA]EKX74034.1 conserved hypothetical protein [Theileria equi strain WA]|eukprot:XP_004833486.1 conserved hypothetical protein [Theileria equi strain WA]
MVFTCFKRHVSANSLFKSVKSALLHKRCIYWPPPPNKRSTIIELPSGKKCFVFMGKRDCDGKLEPVVCFIDRNGDKLTWLNTEEVHQLEKLAPRLLSYFDLWESKTNDVIE